MRNRPVRIVRQGIDTFDREHRPFEGRHPIEGQADHEKLQHRIGRHSIPSTAERQQAIDHPAPRRHPQHQAEQHPKGACPLGQSRVVQVMRTSPDIDEDQRPKVDDAELVRENRTLRCLGKKIIHQPQEGGGQEESHRIVAIPPLY